MLTYGKTWTQKKRKNQENQEKDLNKRVIEQIPLVIMGLLSLAAAGLIFYSTRWGAWAGSDSAAYVAVAKNLAAGLGFQVTRPSGEAATLIAPVYPLLLAGLSRLGLPILGAAHGLNIVLMGVFIFLMGYSVSRLSRSAWLAIPVSLLMVVFPVILDLFSGMMTEPVFLVLGFAGLFLLCFYLQEGKRPYLAGAAILGGLAAITRFIGIALLPLGALALFLFASANWRRKAIDSLVHASLFIAVTLPWDIWYSFHRDTSAPLEMPAWSNPWDYLQPVRSGLVNVFWDWIPFHALLPVDRYLWKVVILTLIVVLFLLVFGWSAIKRYGKSISKWTTDRDIRIIGVMGAFILVYLGVFIFIYLFRIPAQDIDERTLLPIYPALVVIFFAQVSHLLGANPGRRIKTGIAAFAWFACLVGCAAYLPPSLAMLQEYHQKGAGYTGEAWRLSPTIQAVQALPKDTVIISNETGAILFLTGRYGLEITEIYRSSPEEFTRFGDDPLEETQRLFREDGAALVLFQPAFYWRLHELYQDQTAERLRAFTEGLTLYGEYPDGAIYFYSGEQ